MRKKVHGVGVNDADYNVTKFVDGKRVTCNFYLKWSDMIKRCYCKSFQSKNKSYIGCSVDSEWLTFSVFKDWMEKHQWIGMDLDKDLLIQGNKVYSSKTCCFIPRSINSLLTFKKHGRSTSSTGVSYSKNEHKFKASCRVNGKKVNLGTFAKESDAHNAYLLFKRNIIKDVAMNCSEPLKSALLNYDVI